MADSPHTKGPGVSLEQLIQLKRAERPTREFWDGFDRELHRRQLAALVAIEPWHRRAARAFTSAARRIAPMSAGAAALALAVVAILRIDPAASTATEPAETLAVADGDNKVLLLPEEAISVSTRPTSRLSPAVEEFHGHVRSAPQELASGLATARRFVAVSAPVTFSSGDDSSAIYSARALTAGAVLRSLTAATPESL